MYAQISQILDPLNTPACFFRDKHTIKNFSIDRTLAYRLLYIEK